MEREFRIRCSAIGKIMGNAKVKGELSQTCKTYLQEWYANDNDEINSKYINKGNEVENDLIDFMAVQLGFGMAEKNTVRLHNNFLEGECDVDLPTCIVDVKASWNLTTLHSQLIDGFDSNYRWQLIGYCNLYKKPKGILFFGLMNTPETDWSDEVVFDNLPDNERWHAYEVTPTDLDFKSIYDRVIQCRLYLESYDKLIKSKIGRLNDNKTSC